MVYGQRDNRNLHSYLLQRPLCKSATVNVTDNNTMYIITHYMLLLYNIIRALAILGRKLQFS